MIPASIVLGSVDATDERRAPAAELKFNDHFCHVTSLHNQKFNGQLDIKT